MARTKKQKVTGESLDAARFRVACTQHGIDPDFVRKHMTRAERIFKKYKVSPEERDLIFNAMMFYAWASLTARVGGFWERCLHLWLEACDTPPDPMDPKPSQ